MFSIEQLRAFLAVAQELHFGRAAGSLGVSQPTVSKEIRTLEQELGMQLFARSGGTKLTVAGEQLLPHARSTIAAVLRFEAAAERARRTVQGKVRVAASPSVVNRLLPELLRTIEDQELPIAVEVFEADTGEVLSAVESGRCDIGIGHLLGATGRAVVKRRIGWDEIRIVCHDSWRSRAGARSLAGLATLPLLLWPREQCPEYHDHLLQICRDRGLDPLLTIGTSRISGAWSYLLEDARAFTLAPQDFADRTLKAPLVDLPLDPPARIPLEVVWADGQSAVVKSTLRALLAVAGRGAGSNRARPAAQRAIDPSGPAS